MPVQAQEESSWQKTHQNQSSHHHSYQLQQTWQQTLWNRSLIVRWIIVQLHVIIMGRGSQLCRPNFALHSYNLSRSATSRGAQIVTVEPLLVNWKQMDRTGQKLSISSQTLLIFAGKATLYVIMSVETPLAPMGVLPPGSAYAWPFRSAPNATSGIFSAHMGGG